MAPCAEWPIRHRVPERHGGDARQLDADHRGVLCQEADGVRHRRRRRALQPARLGRRRWPRRDLHGRRRLRSGRTWASSATTSSAGSAKAARCSSESRLDLPCFACMLGGEDRETLFMLAADWRMSDSFTDNIARLTEGLTHRPAADRAGSRARRRLAVSRQAMRLTGLSRISMLPGWPSHETLLPTGRRSGCGQGRSSPERSRGWHSSAVGRRRPPSSQPPTGSSSTRR